MLLLEIVRATLPLVEAHLDAITATFYRDLFARHPELGRDLFNRVDQAQGAQPRALAASIARFAASLIDPAAPRPESMLARIGHKHAASEPHPLRDGLFDLATRLPALTLRLRYSAQTADGEPAGFDLDGVELPADADFILCGPTGFLSSVRSVLLERGVPADRVRTEQFGPTDWRDGNG
ncbi:MAG: hypothetical protein HOQ44_17390 [Nocardia sp.]|nr:hypothetical protein [Nocardia sp.]